MTVHKMTLLLVPLLATVIRPVEGAEQCVFPSAAWELTTPESQGVDSAKLQAAVDYLCEAGGQDGVKRMVIVRNGRMIWRGPEADKPQGVWSVTKAFTSTAHGLLIEDGKCSLDTLAKDFDPSLAGFYPTVTLRHLATMTSGLDGVGGGYDYDDQRRGDQNALVEPLPPFFPPGTKYMYWDEATQHYGYTLTQIAGESLHDYLKRRILDPIGITQFNWKQDATGKVLNWTGGIEISAEDLARFGLLFLNRGNWNGRQLINADWVDLATRVQVPPSIPNALPASTRKGSGIYGFHWWPNGVTPEGQRHWPDAPLSTYARSGYNNNDLFIIPAWNMVTVRLGLDEKEDKITAAEYNTFLRMLGEAILEPVVEGELLSVVAVAARDPASADQTANVAFRQSSTAVDAYDFVEVTIDVALPTAANPFTDVVVTGEFRCGDGQPVQVDGFCDSQDGRVFRIRFMPTKSGVHQYSVSYRQGDFEAKHAGSFTARDGGRRGLVRVDPEHPWHFLWEGTGEHYFWNGTTTYFLMGWDDQTIRQALDRLHRLKVNRVRVVIMGRVKDGQAWMENVYPTDKFTFLLNPWVAARPESLENPGFDVTRFNVAHWQKYDRLLRHARDLDMVVSVIFYVDGRRPGTDPFGKSGMGGPDEQRYYRYAVARCAAFSNIMWDVTNEYHLFRDEAWVNKMGGLIRRWDPYGHLASVHGHGEFPFRTSPWADFAMHQKWDEGGGYAFIRSCREKQEKTGRIMPQINEEYGYEDHYPRWGGNRKWPARTADNRRRLAWEMVMAGGYQTTGERADTGTGWGVDTGGGWINGRGDDSMVMLQGYGHLVDFFTSIPWWTLNPDDELIGQPDRPAATTEPTHIVYTRDKQGQAAMYIDGRLLASKQVPGELTNWDPEFRLALANELTGDRAWLGEYYGVAIWDSACSAKEAARRFQAGSRAKPADQPLVHYTFAESRGDTVRDVSGRNEPLNLTIEKPSAVRWLPGGGLRIDSSTRIASAAPAGKIAQAVRRSGELTVEAWVRPANATQAGPARIVTCSADPSRRNFTLGQAAGDFEMRFRTSTTTANGEPSLWSSSQHADGGPNVTALRSDNGELAVLYLARGGQATLNSSKLAASMKTEWYNPRDGSRRPAEPITPNTYRAPDGEDWVLLLRKRL